MQCHRAKEHNGEVGLAPTKEALALQRALADDVLKLLPPSAPSGEETTFV